MTLGEMEARAAKARAVEGDSTRKPRKPRKPKKSRAVLYAVVFVVVAAAGMGAFFLWGQPAITEHELRTKLGTPIGSMIDDRVVVVLDEVTVSHSSKGSTGYTSRSTARTRVTFVNVATGEKLDQKLIDGTGSCRTANADLVWCDLGGLALYDAHTFAKVADVEASVAAASLGPIMHAKNDERSALYVVDGVVATYLLEDGRAAVYDGAHRTVRADDQVPKTLHGRERELSSPDLEMPTTCASTRATGGGRDHIGNSKDTFLHPLLLLEGDLPVFVHHTSIDPKHDKAQLSRLDRAGGVAWTVELGGDCENARMAGTSYVLTTKDPRRRALAVDLGTGTVKWQFGF